MTMMTTTTGDGMEPTTTAMMSVDQLLVWGFRIVATFGLALSAYFLKRFVDAVDRLSDKVDGHHVRIAVLESEVGIVPPNHTRRE